MFLPRQGNIPSQNMSKYFIQTPIKNFINMDKCIPGKNPISVFHSHHEWNNSSYCLVLTSNINYSGHTLEGKESAITFLYLLSLHSHQNFIWAIHMPWAHLCALGTQAQVVLKVISPLFVLWEEISALHISTFEKSPEGAQIQFTRLNKISLCRAWSKFLLDWNYFLPWGLFQLWLMKIWYRMLPYCFSGDHNKKRDN